MERVQREGVVNDTVDGLSAVVAAAADGASVVAYERTVGRLVLGFGRADDHHLAAGGSRLRVLTGTPVMAPSRGFS